MHSVLASYMHHGYCEMHAFLHILRGRNVTGRVVDPGPSPGDSGIKNWIIRSHFRYFKFLTFNSIILRKETFRPASVASQLLLILSLYVLPICYLSFQ